jgi:flavin reductase (DIM6/NTAB) family NADH-FMN oxidoreductase RutF
MACEWTHHLSYNPALVGVSLHPRHASYDNIKATKEFGIGITSLHQNVLSSLAGRDSGKKFDKIKIAEELGFKFSPAKYINVLMTENSSVNFECKLFQEIPLGDHTLFVGEVLEVTLNTEEKPLAYHHGKYWDMTSTLEKPTQELREKVKSLFEKYKKQ